MKIYEKPLAKIEKILVEDVITASGDAPATTDIINETLSNDSGLTNIVGGEERVIVFEW